MGKVALITGVTGQDGAYLSELLLSKGYTVHGVKRRSSLFNTDRIDHLYQDQHEQHVNFKLHHGDLTDSTNLIRIVQEVQPDEIYNLAAMSHVKVSFDTPEYTTPFYPRSPYGVAKLYAFWITKNYREAYGMFACNGILFNHESPLRGETFVTRKITRAAAKISLGLQDKLFMGNIDSERDWGHAKDYVEGMWRMLQQDVAEDYVLATGIKITVREFINMAFAEVGITLKWEGKAENEKGIDISTGKVLVEIDPKYYRPAEVDLLVGDATKAKTNMGWTPTYTVAALCKEMVHADVELFKRDKYLLEGGHKILNYKE